MSDQMIDYSLLREEVARHPCPLLFATVSGAHLYGFPSPDSDYDMRGAHILPLTEVVGLIPGQETIRMEEMRGSVEMDLVTHDVHKFFSMLLKRNGYVLEQLYSPHVVIPNQLHEELKMIARGCITRYHSHHYLGFAATQWRLFTGEEPPRLKPLLYVYRVLLTGIHLMQTGEVEADLNRLHAEYRLPFLADLIARKIAGTEKGILPGAEMEFHRGEYLRLVSQLESAGSESTLPESPTCREELHQFLVRVRMGG